MPFTKDDKRLAGLPAEAAALWSTIANQQMRKGMDDITAIKYAYGAIEKAGYKKKDGKWIKEARASLKMALSKNLGELCSLKESKRHKYVIGEAKRIINGASTESDVQQMIIRIKKATEHCQKIQETNKMTTKREDVSAAERKAALEKYGNEKFAEALEEERKEIISEAYKIEQPKKLHEAVVTVLSSGFNATKSRYYTKEALAGAVKNKVFDGCKMFVDHLSEFAEKQLGGMPRSIKDWTATLKETWLTKDGTQIKGRVEIINNDFYNFLENCWKDIGTSINADGIKETAVIDGVKTSKINSIVKGHSLDWVTEAGAGGKVDLLEAKRIEEEKASELVKESVFTVKVGGKTIIIKEAEEEGRWITINGAHIFIKGGESGTDRKGKNKGGIEHAKQQSDLLGHIEARISAAKSTDTKKEKTGDSKIDKEHSAHVSGMVSGYEYARDWIKAGEEEKVDKFLKQATDVRMKAAAMGNQTVFKYALGKEQALLSVKDMLRSPSSNEYEHLKSKAERKGFNVQPLTNKRYSMTDKSGTTHKGSADELHKRLNEAKNLNKEESKMELTELQEAITALEIEISTLKEANTSLTKERDELSSKFKAIEVKEAKDASQIKIAEAMKKVKGIPEASKAKILESFKDMTVKDDSEATSLVEAASKKEREYLVSLTEGKSLIKGLGETEEKSDDKGKDVLKESRLESYKKAGYTQAQIDALEKIKG